MGSGYQRHVNVKKVTVTIFTLTYFTTEPDYQNLFSQSFIPYLFSSLLARSQPCSPMRTDLDFLLLQISPLSDSESNVSKSYPFHDPYTPSGNPFSLKRVRYRSMRVSSSIVFSVSSSAQSMSMQCWLWVMVLFVRGDLAKIILKGL